VIWQKGGATDNPEGARVDVVPDTLKKLRGAPMEIPEIRVSVGGLPRGQGLLHADADGGFVVRDLKIIEGPTVVFWPALPARWTIGRPRGAAKNHFAPGSATIAAAS